MMEDKMEETKKCNCCECEPCECEPECECCGC